MPLAGTFFSPPLAGWKNLHEKFYAKNMQLILEKTSLRQGGSFQQSDIAAGPHKKELRGAEERGRGHRKARMAKCITTRAAGKMSKI